MTYLGMDFPSPQRFDSGDFIEDSSYSAVFCSGRHGLGFRGFDLRVRLFSGFGSLVFASI